jgi:hypothetical protein
MAQCIKLANSNNFRVVRDFYGYRTGAPRPLSLLTQVRRLQGSHIHLNIIRVGSEFFTDIDEREIDAAIDFTRNNYAQVNLGIGRVERYALTDDQAPDRKDIDNNDEAATLTTEWTVPNDALDVFFVLTYSGDTIGFSRVDGPCDKDAQGMNGSVVAIEGEFITTGFVLAHEVGHYLGLSHSSDRSNLMFDVVNYVGNLTSGQGSTMRDHCFVDSGC